MSRKPKKSREPEKLNPEEALRSKRRNLKEELDRIYYTLPYDEVSPVLTELKDTVECLTEMGETHTWHRHGDLAGHRNRRRAA